MKTPGYKLNRLVNIINHILSLYNKRQSRGSSGHHMFYTVCSRLSLLTDPLYPSIGLTVAQVGDEPFPFS